MKKKFVRPMIEAKELLAGGMICASGDPANIGFDPNQTTTTMHSKQSNFIVE